MGKLSVTTERTLDMQSEKLNKGDIDVNEESGCDQKDKNVPEEVILSKNFTLKEISRTFNNTKCSKDKIWEADPNLERNRIICQDSCSLSLLDEKKASTVQTTLDKSFQKK